VHRQRGVLVWALCEQTAPAAVDHRSADDQRHVGDKGTAGQHCVEKLRIEELVLRKIFTLATNTNAFFLPFLARSRQMQPTSKWMIAAVLFAASGIPTYGSSHREALAILNEPCADNTDTYAWVSDHSHDKLYLIMDFNPLHEPGQGNQGLRACNGYRYEFHVAIGPSLADKVVYRVEFTNTIKPAKSPSPTDAVGGGNEILWQLTGGTETMTVTRFA